MAADNVTLGRFQLTGIPPAPRGVPQIEVSFDIDVNGIVHVGAKDLGTGKEQKITVQASSGLSPEDIDKMVAEAEKFAEEDKKRREAIETRNNADQLIYSVDKAIKDLGDKITDEQKSKINAAKDELQKALEGDDIDAIKAKMDALSGALHEATQSIYQSAQTAQSSAETGQNAGQANDDNVVDAEYTVQDDDKKGQA